MTDEQTFQPATRSTWRKAVEATASLVLPSGNPVVIRDPALQDLLAEIASITPLTGIASRILDAAQGGGNVMEVAAQVMGATPDLYELTGPLCEAVFVSPKIVDDPKADGEIPLGLLSRADRMFVLLHFLGMAETLMSFFPQPGDGDSSGPVEPALREDAE